MGRSKDDGAGSAGCVYRSARIAPRARNPGGVLLEGELLVVVARLSIPLHVGANVPCPPREQVDGLVVGRQRTELGRIPKAAAAAARLGRVRGIASAAGKGHEQRTRRALLNGAGRR